MSLPQNIHNLQAKGNKYHARRTWSSLCNRQFDSNAEARRGEELALLERGKVISDLRYQVRFLLCNKPHITVSVDFAYLNHLENGERVYEDVKGVLTRDSRTKYAWLKEKHGVSIKLTT